MSKEFATVYLPYPGMECITANGARVELPNGSTVPNIGDVQISASAGELVEVTVKMLAHVETMYL